MEMNNYKFSPYAETVYCGGYACQGL